MLSLFVISILVIGLIGMAGYSALTLQHSNSLLSSAQRNTAQMHALSTAIASQLRDARLDGSVAVPMGENLEGGWTTAPSWLGLSTRTPWGVPYGYCPYASDEDILEANALVVTVEGNYPVDIASNPVTGGRAYVVASPAPPVPGVLAFILSPEPNGRSIPRCEEVRFEQGRFTVDRGQVMAITGRGAFASQLTGSANIVTLHVGPAATGDGSGRSTGNQITLDGAVSLWGALRPAHTELRLSPGLHVLSTSFPNEPTAHLSLSITGAGMESTTIAPAAGTVAVRAPGSRLSLADLSLADGVSLELTDNVARLQSVRTATVSLTDSQASFSSTVEVWGGSIGDYPLVARNSALHTSGAFNIVTRGSHLAGAYLVGSRWHVPPGAAVGLTIPSGRPGAVMAGTSTMTMDLAVVSGSPLSGQPASLISIDGSSRLHIGEGARLIVGGHPVSALYVAGRVDLRGAQLLLPDGANAGIYLAPGGEVGLSEGARVGDTSANAEIGVFDAGGRLVTGDTAAVFAAEYCWAGPLFAYSVDADGAYSSPVPHADEPPPALRILNTSHWVCSK